MSVCPDYRTNANEINALTSPCTEKVTGHTAHTRPKHTRTHDAGHQRRHRYGDRGLIHRRIRRFVDGH